MRTRQFIIKKHFMTKKRFLLLAFLPIFMVSVVASDVFMPRHAAEAAFNKNNLMDDYVMTNSGTMNAGQINSFLNAFPNSCISQNRGFAAPEPTGYSSGGGYTYGGFVSAGQVITAAAQAYHINPQVLLVTLQKEQSLVNGNAGCTVKRYTAAMGYGCPDSGGSYNYSGLNLYSINGSVVSSVDGTCVNSASKAGFSPQVIRAAWLLRFGQERSRGNTGWAEIHGNWNNSDDLSTCYGGPMTQGDRKRCPNGATSYFDGYITIDGQATHMDTGATAALYWYTPHFHGNENFVSIFQAWFGPTSGQGFVKAISDDPNDLRQWVIYANIKQYIPDSQTINAWNLGDVTLTTMPAAQLNAIPTGPSLGRLMVLNDGSPTIYFVDGGKRYKIPWMTMFSVWNFPGQVISGVSPGLFVQPVDGGSLTHSVKNPANSTKYMVDGRDGNGRTVLRPYSNDTVMAAWEGSSTSFTSISSDYFDVIDNAIGSSLTHTKMGIAGSEFEAISGIRFPLASNMSTLFPGTAQQVSWETYFRMPMGGFITHLIQSNTSPALYLIDGGTKHQILWPDAATAWQGPNHPVSVVNDSALSLISTGASIGGYLADAGGQLYVIDRYKTAVPAALDDAYRNSGSPFNASAALMSIYYDSGQTLTGFIKPRSAPQVYLLDDSGDKRHIEWASKVEAYGGYNAGITVLSDYVANNMTTAASPSVFVTDGSTEYLIDGGKKWTVSGSVKTDWGFGTAQSMTDGTLDRFATGGALTNKVRTPSGAYVLIKGGIGYATADPNIAAVWGLASAPVMSNALFSNTVPVSMLTRFVKSSIDARNFVINNGDWFTVSAAQLANLGGTGVPTMSLNPSLAPNVISDWTSIVVKSTGGTHYAIDGGGKRFFPHPIIQNQWTNNGSITVPTVSDGFLNLLPTRGYIERTIKGSGPSVYFYENGAKRHIRFPDTYQQNYAPYMQVTDQLLDVIPTGPVI